MYEELNAALAVAAQRVAQFEKLQRRLQDLQTQEQQAEADLRSLDARATAHDASMQKLAGVSLTGIFYQMLGSREQQLEALRQQALRDHFQAKVAEQRLARLQASIAETLAGLQPLAGAPQEQTRALEAKEAAIQAARDTRVPELFRLAEQVHRQEHYMEELRQAIAAGESAAEALAPVAEALESASNWGVWDMLGKGGISTLVKHGYIDDAAAAAQRAEPLLDAFRRELQEVGDGLQSAGISVEAFSRFVDLFFHNLITDWIIQSSIIDTLRGVHQTEDEVRVTLQRLDGELAKARAALAEAVESHRHFVEQLA